MCTAFDTEETKTHIKYNYMMIHLECLLYVCISLIYVENLFPGCKCNIDDKTKTNFYNMRVSAGRSSMLKNINDISNIKANSK